MSNTESQVVVAYDFSHSGKEALYKAIALAKRAPFHVLHFIYVCEPGNDFAQTERVQQSLTDQVAQELRASGVESRVHFFVHVRIGHAAKEILDLAEDVGADLIIIGSKGLTGVERLVLGSVAEKVVREARCTVEVARAKGYRYVALDKVVDATVPHHKYVAPHRYSYEDHRVDKRPNDWPLY